MLKGQVVPVTGFAQNCSVVWCDETNEGALIDPGGDVEKILAAVKKHGIELKQIFLTHGHADHAGGAMDIAEQLDLPIIGPHKDDAFWLDGIESASCPVWHAGPKELCADPLAGGWRNRYYWQVGTEGRALPGTHAGSCGLSV